MHITNSMLSLPRLIALSFWTYLKALPFLLVVYFIPALFLVAMISPHMSEFLQISASVTSLQGATDLFAEFIEQPIVIFVSVAFLVLLVYGINFAYLLTESLVNKERGGIFSVIINSITSIPRYLTDGAAFFAILFLFTGLPLLPAYFFELPTIVKVLLGVIWFFGFVFSLIFMVSSLFFTRVAVLRGKWPGEVFTYSAKLVKARFFKMVVFMVIIGVLAWAATAVLNSLLGIPFGLAVGLFNMNPDLALMPFTIISNGLILFFVAVSNTILFLNLDYNINYDRNKMELFSRAAAIHDNSMPSLK